MRDQSNEDPRVSDKEKSNTDMRESLNYSTKEPVVETEPVNKKIYWYSVIAGFAVLAPWNAVLTCLYFFETLYEPDYDPQFTLPMIIFFPLTSCQILLLAFGKNLPMRAKVVGSLAMLTFFFYMFLFLCKYIENKATSFYIAVITCLLIGGFNAVSQSSITGLCGALGGNGLYMNGIMLGNGVSGVLSSLLQFICMAVFGTEEEDLFHSTTAFFIVTALLMIFSTYISYRLLEDPLTQEVLKRAPAEKTLKEIFSQAWPVFKGQGKNVFLVFVFTFIVFPGVYIAKPLSFLSVQWSIPFMIFLFNLFDTIGRYTPSFIRIVSPKGTTWLCILRGLSSLSICLIGYGTFNGFFVSDWWIILNFIIFAFTNGAASTYAMMYGTEEFPNEQKENAGRMMAFFLTFGIFTGSLLAQLVFEELF